MTEHQSSYRQIMKATALFGGVQIINVFVQIIRSKVVAVLLGPTGMGILGLLNSTMALMGSLTNFGLKTSAVKDISAEYVSLNNFRIAVIITTLRRLVWITGCLGTLLVLIFSSLLSKLTFGNNDFTIAFIWISVTLLFQQLSSGQFVILQGMRKLKSLAKANVLGSCIGLVVTLPLYYIYGTDGIVPGILGTSLVTLFLSWYFSNKVAVEPVNVSYSQTLSEGKSMLRMGFMISLSGLLTTGGSYIVRIFISRTGGIDEVGLYNAGFSIINTYVGMIFSAMATDYYPRLSAVAHDNFLCKKTINQQAEIALLILSPILIVFLVFINWIVVLLYSNQFIAVNTMIYWAAMGMFFKSSSWSIGFIFLAKGSSRLFLWNEIITNLYLLGLNIIGYHYWGLTGLGVSFAVSYLLHLLQVFVVSRIKFSFSFDLAIFKIFFVQFSMAVISFFVVTNLSADYSYIVGMFLVVASSWYSFVELDKRLSLSEVISNFKNRIGRK